MARKAVVLVCPACHSHVHRSFRIDGKERHVCSRCGHVFSRHDRKPRGEAAALVRRRRSHLARTSRQRRLWHLSRLERYVRMFHLRMFLYVLGLALLSLGLVLLPSSAFAMGLFFVVLGLGALYAALRWA